MTITALLILAAIVAATILIFYAKLRKALSQMAGAKQLKNFFSAYKIKVFAPLSETLHGHENGEAAIARAGEYWDSQVGTWTIGRGRFWLEHPRVRQRNNRLVSGDENMDRFQWLICRLRENGTNLPLERCVTLGCGGGDLEIGLAGIGFCKHHDAFDISEKSIHLARQRALEMGYSHLHFSVEDVNNIKLPESTFDGVFCHMAAHHFNELEYVFGVVAKSLKPGGFFFLDEYVGPNRFQWTDKQLRLMNVLLMALPERHRQLYSGGQRTQIQRSTEKQIIAVDPTEAVRSAEISEILTAQFRIVERRDYGGTLLHSLLDGIAWTFPDEKPQDTDDLLEWLFRTEDVMLAAGEISSDFAVFIARDPNLSTLGLRPEETSIGSPVDAVR